MNKYLLIFFVIAATALFPAQAQTTIAAGAGFKECKFKHKEPGWDRQRLLSWYIVDINEKCPVTPIAKHFIVTKTVSRNGDRITWSGRTRSNVNCTIKGTQTIVRDRFKY